MIPAYIADRENRKRRGELDNDNHVGANVGYTSVDFDDFDDDDEVVLETKGSSPPPMPSPMEQAQAQMELERERARLAEEAAQRQRQLEEQQRQQLIEKAQGKQTQAYNSALNYGTTQVGARGYDQGLIDKYGLMNLYNDSIDRTRLGIGETDVNPMASYNYKTDFNNALDTALGAYRGDLKKSINEFAGDGFEYNAFADTADDPILQSILDSRRGDALAQIDAAKARGQLNDTGYSRALSSLDEQGKSAWSDLQNIGLGVLSGYRKDLTGLRDNELTKIGSWDFTNAYDTTGFQNRLDTRKNDLLGGMEGDLFKAVQGQSFFDPSSIISGSGAIQGYYNPLGQAGGQQSGAGGANPLLDAFTNDNNQQNKQQQNTGNWFNGVF